MARARPHSRPRSLAYQRIHALLAVAVFFCAVGALGIRAWRGVRAAFAPATPIIVPLTVQPGQSLWTLARRYGDPGVYILDRVDALARANSLSSDAALVPGQKIVVPVTNPVEVAKIRQMRVAAARHP